MVGDHHGASVLDDDELTATLESLGLGRENHRAVVLLPLIEVAWADGRIQKAERLRIVQIARQYGIDGKSEWLARYLRRKPSRKTFLAARTALLDLMARAGHNDQPIDSLDRLLEWCVWIAEAAGGLFGLAFTVERSERECIEQIAASLSLGPAVPDGLVEQWEMARRRHFLAEAPTGVRRRGPRYGILDQTTAHLNFSQITTATLEGATLRGTSTSPTLDPPVASKPTLDPDPGPIPVAKERASARPVAHPPSRPPSSPPGPTEPLGPTERLGPTEPLHPKDAREVRTTERPISVDTPTHKQPPFKKGRPVPTPPPPPVPAHLAAVSHPGIPSSSIHSAHSAHSAPVRKRSIPTVSKGGRSVEEDPTLPFFDDVNVGTYVEPSE